MSLFASPLSFSSPSYKPLARSPSLSRGNFFSFIFFFFSALPLFSLSFFSFFTPSPSAPPLLFAHVFRMLLRAVATAENTTTDQLCPEDVEREELTIRQFKSAVPIPTVTPITIFHITHGRGNKGSYTATLRWIMK